MGIFYTGMIQLRVPVLSSETVLHISLSSENSGFRPSSMSVVILTRHNKKQIKVELGGILYQFPARIYC